MEGFFELFHRKAFQSVDAIGVALKGLEKSGYIVRNQLCGELGGIIEAAGYVVETLPISRRGLRFSRRFSIMSKTINKSPVSKDDN